ncbi:ATP-binding protein [Bacillus thuringiensis]|uniref:ATP-binding protein n=2 Tax=Bacillus thuringiensis TaxID=1428 RepID=A0ABD5HUQ8_BACTU|nr:AAA family ATPase [Bacillus thuringiensis]MCR6778688.1 ATP-binding protein [Bacillus thuringiensis]MCR6862746.1 ATP-binding protein [Bacillus thuringiensis]MCR6868029.1 ATP-binding protein [Bacillus thuringiensis]MDW9208691.1 ATP-binding protein [Bacillus thuringiensis serovar toumanoffi]MED2617728.1 AAA family ATPase [Bacillus thuringiensis]
MCFLQMSGFPGAGKSTVSKYIAKLTGAIIVDHDVLKSALLKSLEVKGIESTIVGGLAYDAEWALIDSYLEQGHSVILDSPCLYEGMVEKGIKLSNKHGVKYKYIECYLNDMEEINVRLQTRKRMISQIEKVESEVGFKKWLNGSKKPLNSEYLIVDSSEPLERYAENMIDYMSR